MGHEIELKLNIHRDDVQKLVHHPLLTGSAAGEPTKRKLVNRYYDTPDYLLRQHHMALRVRWNGDAYVQTLKRKGKSRRGLTERGEWEWPLAGADPDVSLVPEALWPAPVRTRMGEMAPVFRTDFTRTAWFLRFPSGNIPDMLGSASVEAALDQGEIVVDTGRQLFREEILEVELELLEGNSDMLYVVWKRLGEALRLDPLDISKAERGYRLLSRIA